VLERLVLKANGRMCATDLPSDVFKPLIAAADAQTRDAAGPEAEAQSVADELAAPAAAWRIVLVGRLSAFMSAISRATISGRSCKPVSSTNGNYRLLVQLFNMPNRDYKRFLSFLRKHDCHCRSSASASPRRGSAVVRWDSDDQQGLNPWTAMKS
jgi:hypothetical protein